MDGHFIDASSDMKPAFSPSPLMKMVFDCMGGQRRWTGSVAGLLGLIRRSFVIESQGELTVDGLSFRETLHFDDGEIQKRVWRIFEDHDGLALEGDGIALIRHGRMAGKGFEISYKVKFGALSFDYDDIFNLNSDGGVNNFGDAKLFGFKVMRIEAYGILV